MGVTLAVAAQAYATYSHFFDRLLLRRRVADRGGRLALLLRPRRVVDERERRALSSSLNVNVLAPCAEALEQRTSAQTAISTQTAPRAKRARASDTGTGNIE